MATEHEDVMAREIPPEVLNREYFLARETGDEIETVSIDTYEHLFATEFIRVLRHEGPTAKFLKAVIGHECGAIQFDQPPRLTVNDIKAMADKIFGAETPAEPINNRRRRVTATHR